MSEPRHRLRVIHISDLHERGPRETERWRRYRVRLNDQDRRRAKVEDVARVEEDVLIQET
jgi:hypothetical protein